MTTNHVQLNLDLDSETGVKALLALAGAFAPQKISLGRQVVQGVPVDEAALALSIDASKLQVESGPLSGEPTAPEGDHDPESEKPAEEPKPAKAAVKRRRTKAQKEEDEAEGLDDAFQKALKEHPDLDVDTLRDMIRGNREAEVAETDIVCDNCGAQHPEGTPCPGSTADPEAPAVDDAFDPPATEEQPTGVTPTASAGWNPPWEQ